MKEIANYQNLERKELIILFILVLVSGNPLFSNSTISPLIIAAATLYSVLSFKRGDHAYFGRKLLLIIMAFILIFITQTIKFGVYPIFGYLFFIFKILCGGIIINKIGPAFCERLFSIVFFISFVSLICYAALLAVGPDAMPGFEDPNMLGQNVKSMVIFTVLLTDQWWRNSSMFWEPGAFQAIINLSLIILPASAWIERQRRLKMISVLLALATTFSTTGYLLFFVIAIFKSFESRVSWIIRLPLIGFALAIAVIATLQLDFLGEKIVGQFERSIDTTLYYGTFSPDRFGSLLFDMHYIEKNPLFGNGITEETRFSDHPELHGLSLGHSNGLSNFVATFGIFGAIVYFYGLATGPTGATRRDRLALAVVVAVIAFGEQFLGYALFLGLPFLRLTELKSTVTTRSAHAILP